jgi:YidC/Oxa1 family membrane protein insertase
MATTAAIRSLLRRSRPSSLLYLPRVLTSHLPPPQPSPFTPHSPSSTILDAFRTRAFSTSSSNDRDFDTDSFSLDSTTHSEILKAVADSASAGGEDISAFPVRVVISMLDSFHDLTGFPW